VPLGHRDLSDQTWRQFATERALSRWVV